MSSITENVLLAKARIAAAAREAGRDPGEIRLLAATKMNAPERIAEAVAAGVDLCGENRVQEFLAKSAVNAYAPCAVHFIGHLQKNKVKYLVGLVELIHSVDSVELMREIDRQARRRNLTQEILLEVNTGGEASKSGFAPEALPEMLAAAAEFPAVSVRGLMTIPPICRRPEENLPYFQLLHQLFIDNSEKKYDNVRMDFMSMGMSGDYEAAIACGANMVRVGTAIFGRRNYPAKS